MDKKDEKKLQSLPIEDMEVLNDELILVKGGRGHLDLESLEPGGGDKGCHCGCA